MFDNTCKFLAETFSEDFATWLLGESMPLTQLSPTELSLEPIRADALILLQSKAFILHLEFQTQPDETMGFRMLDYRTRLYRRYPAHRVEQVVIYLKPSDSELVQQTVFEIPGTRHEFRVIRLWEQPLDIFLQFPGLIPFAALSKAPEKLKTLQAAAAQIQTLGMEPVQQNIAAATAILAGLVLEQSVIQQILRREMMRDSVIYQDILAEGRAEGRAEGEQSLILRLLPLRIGDISPTIETQIRALSITQLEALAEALLGFSSPSDLDEWLQSKC